MKEKTDEVGQTGGKMSFRDKEQFVKMHFILDNSYLLHTIVLYALFSSQALISFCNGAHSRW